LATILQDCLLTVWEAEGTLSEVRRYDEWEALAPKITGESIALVAVGAAVAYNRGMDAALLLSPQVTGMIGAAARRAGIYGGIGTLDTEDVLSELTCVALVAAREFEPATGYRFTSYLWPRLVGACFDLLRRHGRHNRSGYPRLVLAPLEDAEDAAMPETKHDDTIDLNEAISRLPGAERAALLMREYGHEPATAIAAMLGGDKTSARLLSRQAVRRLRVGLRAE
jgi:RNA polymerase sigma factor (sigma-70 family)